MNKATRIFLIVILAGTLQAEQKELGTIRMNEQVVIQEDDPVWEAEKPGVLQKITDSTNLLEKVAHTGEYSDLKNLPPLPPTPQAMTNIAETVTGVATGKLATVAHTGDYDDLLNKPLSFSETDPVAIPRIEALEANTNHWNAAITNEQDLAALRLYHYGSTDIVESPADWFTWSVSGGKATVTGLNWGGEWWDPPDDPAKLNIVIPWEYDGVPVEAIGDFAFSEYELDSLRAPKTLVSVESHAFAYADIGSLSLPAATSAGDAVFVGLYTPSLHLPAATSIGIYAFMDANISSLHLPAATTLGDEVFSFAHSLGSITFSRMPTTIGVDIFNGVSPLPTVYITDLTDPNTDTSLQGAPIVRPTINPAAVAGSGHAIAEQVVTGAVCTAESGYRYFWTSATNVVLSVNLTSGQVVNLAKLNNTATNSITAIGQVGWEWTGGDMTNTIAAGKSMTFGFLIDAATGKTNAYATGVSK